MARDEWILMREPGTTYTTFPGTRHPPRVVLMRTGKHAEVGEVLTDVVAEDLRAKKRWKVPLARCTFASDAYTELRAEAEGVELS